MSRTSTDIHPIASPWGRFHLYTFFIDAPEPAIVDTGIASSPAEGMAPALERLGRRIEDVRWILLTHGHIDHMGGAHALWEMTGRKAKVVIHADEAHLLRSRRAHVLHYLDVRDQYLRDPDGEAAQTKAADAVISGEMEPTVVLHGGETLSLGGDVTVTARNVPGHSAGAMAYVIDGQNDAFVGDSVQVYGAAAGFPGYEDPDAYRSSLLRLRDEVAPRRMYLGHPYRNAEGTPYGVELDHTQADEALRHSIDREARIREAAERYFADGGRDSGENSSLHAPFGRIADDLGYTGDPRLEPSPFFATLHGYRRLFASR